MQRQERIKRAQEVMKLSNEEMASFLGIEEGEYLRMLDHPDDNLYRLLNRSVGISMTYLKLNFLAL